MDIERTLTTNFCEPQFCLRPSLVPKWPFLSSVTPFQTGCPLYPALLLPPTSWASSAGLVPFICLFRAGKDLTRCLQHQMPVAPQSRRVRPKVIHTVTTSKVPLETGLSQNIPRETHSLKVTVTLQSFQLLKTTVLCMCQLICAPTSSTTSVLLVSPFLSGGNNLYRFSILSKITVPKWQLWDSHPSSVTVEPDSSHCMYYLLPVVCEMQKRKGKE